MTRAQEQQESDQREVPTLYPTGMRLHQQAPAENPRRQRDRTEIKEQRRLTYPFLKSLCGGSAYLHGPFELRQSLVDEVETNMGRSFVAVFLGRALAGQLDRLGRHLAF